MQSAEPKYIIVVGASAGGLNVVIDLCAQLKPAIDAAVLVVLHFSRLNIGKTFIQQIQKQIGLTCKLAEHEEPLRSGHVYLAVPDRHLLVGDDKILLGAGPHENRWRPSIDVLFRSAAASYDGRVIGIILSGMMQDGTAGMLAIKRCGGTCIVQDPGQADYADMPYSVLNNVEVDYCVPLEMMGAILQEKVSFENPGTRAIPPDVKAEAEIASRVALGINRVQALGERSNYVCPDCGGGLWEMVNDQVKRYRCYTGHVFSQNELLVRQDEKLEDTLWTALRMMEERRDLLVKMAMEEEQKGFHRSAANKQERAAELHVHIDKLKTVLFTSRFDNNRPNELQYDNRR